MDTKRVTKKKKIRILTLRYGTKFGSWWEDNLKYMIDTYSNLEYDQFITVKETYPIFEDDDNKMMNKLVLFDKFRDNNHINIYFDLDVIIKGDCNKFLREDFTLLDTKSWALPETYDKHGGLCSDIMSWSGDLSKIYLDYIDEIDYNYLKWPYTDSWFNNYKHNRYTTGYTSIRCKTNFDDHDVVCFNGHASTMAKRGWWQEYTQSIKPYWESAEI